MQRKILNIDDYRKQDAQQVIFKTEDALVEFIHDWLESILTKKEMLIVASRIEDMEIGE